ncbi:PHP domain-containing protein [Aliiglaciecola sp. LCG003]|uniref:PHP domain-containing protein n=1 Tax=Aliiglaciecola sp. LCG003 TaxID=3053655 RepID=UPI002573F92D|nr:PHP domain-containing protein [Aliiglaciecola sp. LCG003]WJG10850.1 PHP domain-containing protein [Aliiglaciecola sp. LCG003]
MIEPKKIDLHSHSHYSDGHLSPEELLMRAHNMQVDVLALTDHDTVQGIAELLEYQQEYKRDLTIIPGVEISTSWHGFDIHIVGLNVDHQDSLLLERLACQSKRREDRALKIAHKLDKAGVPGIYEIAKSLAGKGQITRAHFARALIKQQAVSDMESAFKKYLGKGKKAHVKPEWISFEEAIQWIQEAGGQAVLAHPGHYDMTAKWLRRLVGEFAAANGDGIEANHPHLAATKRQLLVELTLEHKLLASTGSDFHFPSRWTELGKNLSVPDKLTPIWHNWASIAA